MRDNSMNCSLIFFHSCLNLIWNDVSPLSYARRILASRKRLPTPWVTRPLVPAASTHFVFDCCNRNFQISSFSEADWAQRIAVITIFASKTWCRQNSFLMSCGCVRALCGLLKASDTEIIKVILGAFRNLLEVCTCVPLCSIIRNHSFFEHFQNFMPFE